MRRLHLFEWEDQAWLPTVLRDFITDHLRYTANEPMRQPTNEAIAQRIGSLLRETGASRIVDLCAGGGGPMVSIGRLLINGRQHPVEIVLTDLYPNVSAMRRLATESEGALTPRYEPTSALDVPGALHGIRTLFTAFHHFQPSQARLILADAVRKRAPIAIFEPLERTWRMAALITLGSLIRGVTHTPRVGRLTPSRFVATYILPVAPVVFAWDGLVSVLRSYTVDELLVMAEGIEGQNYRWDAGRFEMEGPYGRMPTTYLVGLPRSPS